MPINNKSRFYKIRAQFPCPHLADSLYSVYIVGFDVEVHLSNGLNNGLNNGLDYGLYGGLKIIDGTQHRLVGESCS